MGGYIPATEKDQQEMLQAIGASRMSELFCDVPEALRVEKLNLPKGKSELEVRRVIQGYAAQNKVFPTVFRGAGAYRHYIPAIVRQVAAKETFVTAYTPYQAEISQGILQAIFEYQSEMCMLTGMDVSNASVYDGAAAAAEAVVMCAVRGRRRVLVAENAHPDAVATIKTYAASLDWPVETVPAPKGVVDTAALQSALGADVACLYLQSPNYWGLIEDVAAAAGLCHAAGAKLVQGCNPIALGLLQTPGEAGADIAVGEAQPLGLPLAFGGPYLGFMACRKPMMRQLPGRIVGQTQDADGRRCFVLTLQAREQHIRREKASSSICSNQALCALTATAYLAAMGPQGLAEAAAQCYAKAHYLAGALAAAGYPRLHEGDFFHEFVTKTPVDAALLEDRLAAEGILGGLAVKGGILWCCTEMNTREEMDRLAAVCGKAAGE